MLRNLLVALAAALCLAALPAGAASTVPLAEHGFFFVGGHYIETAAGQVMTGQMYVEYFVPQRRQHRTPIVLVHGGGGTGAIYEGTPDGRPAGPTTISRAASRSM